MRQNWILGSAAILVSVAALLISSSRANNQKEFDTALVHRSCAPWDGPAVQIEFYVSPARCGRPQVSNLRIALWRDLPPVAGQKMELGGNSKMGVASYCPQENQCEAAKSGSLVIESYEEGKGASGSYDLVFPKAGRLAGRFRAAWCAVRIRCG
jgi:hypothetical protein